MSVTANTQAKFAHMNFTSISREIHMSFTQESHETHKNCISSFEVKLM